MSIKKVLLDTQVIIWFAEGSPLLSKGAVDVISDTDYDCYVSMASLWEISIKINLGKLEINDLTLARFIEELAENDFLTLDIQTPHVLQNGLLPFFHRDPFDRLIISQAISEGMAVVSSDIAFDSYPVTRVW